MSRIISLSPDFLVVVAYGRILPDALLAAPRFAPVNLHFSLLPRYRGAAPVEPAILNGDPDAGYCYTRMEAALDAGPVYSEVRHTLTGIEYAGDLYRKFAEEGGQGFPELLRRISLGLFVPAPQTGEPSFAPKLTREMGHLDPSETNVQVHRHIRAFSQRIGTYVLLGDKKLKVHEATPVDLTLPPATLIFQDDQLYLGCGQGSLHLQIVQAEGGKRISGTDYGRGNLPIPLQVH